MALSEHQSEKESEIIQALIEKEKRILLKGSAGVGKTYLLNHLIERFRNEVNKFGTIWVTAPTHKALQVLREKIEAKSYIKFATIHSGLKLVRTIDKRTGIESYVKKKYNPRYPALEGCILHITDESSMLTKYLLAILEDSEFRNIQTLALGDSKQIRGVNEEVKAIFALAEYSNNYENCKLEGDTQGMNEWNYRASKLAPLNNPNIFDLSRLKYTTVELTEIVRQGKDNPIIELSYGIQYTLSQLMSKENNVTEKTKIVRKDLTEEELQAKVQELIDNPYTFVNDNNEIPDKTYIEYEVVYQGGYVYTNDRNRIVERLAQVNGTNELKYLAYNNSDVDAINNDVRKKIYGDNVKKVEQDEILVLNAPYGEFHTNEEVKVNEVRIANFEFIVPNENSDFSTTDGVIVLNQKVLRNHKDEELKNSNNNSINNFDKITMKVYRIFVSSINRPKDEQINGYMTIIHEDSEAQWSNLARQIKSHCRGGVLSYEAEKYFNEQIADTKYAHALTAHKSQGSTFTKVIINVASINMLKNLEEKKELFYTAITRASELVILYNVK